MAETTKKQIISNTVFLAVVLCCGMVVENTYYLQIMTFIGINTLLALGLNMLMGYAGQVSLGMPRFTASALTPRQSYLPPTDSLPGWP